MKQQYRRSDSKVDVSGFEACYHDLLMNFMPGGTCPLLSSKPSNKRRYNPGMNSLSPAQVQDGTRP